MEFGPYRFLGACNPPLSHLALTEERDIGLLLPCIFVVFAGETPDTSVVAAMDPKVQLSVSGRADIEPLADEVKARIERVLAAL